MAEDEKCYFAYGSNMDLEDLRNWCCENNYAHLNLTNRKAAKLAGYKLDFNYFSSGRKCGAANIMPAPGESVYGILCKLSKSDLDTIRIKEGYPLFYNEIFVSVETFDGTKIQNVLTYKVVKGREKSEYQPPLQSYVGLIIKNAVDFGFPQEYITYLKSLPTTD
jgi:hypothetical protein